MAARAFLFQAICLVCCLTGCASFYFHDAGPEPSSAARAELTNSSSADYWMGIVFNGTRIGFSHFTSTLSQDGKSLDITAEMVLGFHLLATTKNVTLQTWDRVNPDLTLREFRYEYIIDGSRILQEGRTDGNRLLIAITSGDRPDGGSVAGAREGAGATGRTEKQEISFTGKLYPAGVIDLFPVRQGMGVGKDFSYQIYEGQTQSITPVRQQIVGFERSELFAGEAYKVTTSLLGQDSSIWIGRDGLPRLEIAQNGIIISGLEPEYRARQYLVEGMLNKADPFIDYSLIPTMAIPAPRRTVGMEILITTKEAGTDPTDRMEMEGVSLAPGKAQERPALPSDDRQECNKDLGSSFVCRIEKGRDRTAKAVPEIGCSEAGRYLLPTQAAPSHDQVIKDQAVGIAGEASSPLAAIELLLQWLDTHIEKKPVDAFSALDVLEKGSGECQGLTYVYTALARALAIPTKIVNGIVYSEGHQGFLYHTWAESCVEGQWLTVDPAFSQIDVDATHVKIVTGETPSELTPLFNLVGKIRAEVREVW